MEHSDEKRAATLAAYKANGGNLKKTARECGVPATTLRRWIDEQMRQGSDPGPDRSRTPEKPAAERVAAILPLAVEELSSRLREATRELLDSVSGKIKDADLKDVMVAVGIAIDKDRLLNGQATTISGTEVSEAERVERLRELVERGRGRRLGLFDPGGAKGVGQPPPATGDLGAQPGSADGGVPLSG